YVHEMGHVAALRRFGIQASAPMFVPGVGAFVRLQQRMDDPTVDAEVGLAGPRWGMLAAAAATAGGVLFASPLLLALGRSGAWINIFNLLPVWQLDGARAFTALSRGGRVAVACVLGALAWWTGDVMLVFVAVT